MKSVFELMQFHNHEQVVFCNDNDAGLRAIIAVHSTRLGPALGGVRMWPYSGSLSNKFFDTALPSSRDPQRTPKYASDLARRSPCLKEFLEQCRQELTLQCISEFKALWDVLNLSRDMTYKAAFAGLELGGGKAVIIGDSAKDKSEKLFRAFGRYVEGLGGRYIASEDVGTTVEDLEYARHETEHIAGTDPHRGGRGDPSPLTALGVFHGIEACLEHTCGNKNLKGKTVAVQGAGKVGSHLVHRLIESGAKIIISDIDDRKTMTLSKTYDLEVCGAGEIYDRQCDVFSPCALGGVLNDDTIPRLKCGIVAGGANSQLERREHADALHRRGVLYVPDYAINAGGLINVGGEHFGWDVNRIVAEVEGISGRISDLLSAASSRSEAPLNISDEIAERSLEPILS